MAGSEGGQCETSCVYYWICVKSAARGEYKGDSF